MDEEKDEEKQMPLIDKRKIVSTIILMGCILGIALLAFLLSNRKGGDVSKELVECIANKSIIYSQLGCSHCIKQEKEFGKYKDLLNKIDCFYNESICINKQIRVTPTWEVDGKLIEGYYNIKDLRNITGC